MTQEEMKIELEELAVRFSEGWHEGIKIDASDIMLLNKAAQALTQEQEPVSNDPLPRACNLAGVDYQTFLKIKAYMPVAPPQRTWVGLTKKEILLVNEKQDESIIAAPDDELIQFARAIEAKLKEKNNGI